MYETRNIYNPNEDCRWSGTCCGGSAKCVRCINRDIMFRIASKPPDATLRAFKTKDDYDRERKAAKREASDRILPAFYHEIASEDYSNCYITLSRFNKFLHALDFARKATDVMYTELSKCESPFESHAVLHSKIMELIYEEYERISVKPEMRPYIALHRFVQQWTSPSKLNCFVIDKIGHTNRYADGSCLYFTGIALTDGDSGKCFIVDRLAPGEEYEEFSLPKIQLVGIPPDVFIDKGMGLKICAGLIRTDKDDVWYLGHCEDRRVGDHNIEFLKCYSELDWYDGAFKNRFYEPLSKDGGPKFWNAIQ